MAAVPLAMGLFTPNTLADWHPAQSDLREACKKAASICVDHGVDIATLALVFALSNPQIPCTILGMKNVEEVKHSYALASRFHKLVRKDLTQDKILKAVLEDNEYKALLQVRGPTKGPFAQLWKDGNFAWDGVAEARQFWEKVEDQEQENWHTKQE